MTKLESEHYNDFIETVGSQVKSLPLIGLIFINKLVAQELMSRFNDMAEEALKRRGS